MLAADAEASVQTSSMPDITQSLSQKKGQKQKRNYFIFVTPNICYSWEIKINKWVNKIKKC